MNNFRNLHKIAGWLTFAVTFVVYFFSVERTGSLWDCGEFISAAYKLQVVHPPGAAFYVLVGRLFAWVAETFSADPSAIGHALNLMSAVASAFAAAFIAWSTSLLTKMAFVGRGEVEGPQATASAFSGLIAGLTTAFCTSIWFSAVEGEVYALSTFFTAITIWSIIHWYELPKDPQNDRWIILSIFLASMSIGVHLLSLLTFPALALFYYYKKFENRTLIGAGIAMIIGVALIGIIQKLVIIGLPQLWYSFDYFMVNSLGLPPNSGIIPLLILLALGLFFGFRYARKKSLPILHHALLAFTFAVIGYSSIGVVVIRSNANPPINMNDPSDPSRLIPYINREQYGERPLVSGPHYNGKVVRYDREDRYGLVDGKYEKISEKITPVYNRRDNMLFPRMGHMDRKQLYQAWIGKQNGNPTFADNISFFLRYQIDWMYIRYFMWNFVGRQNGVQGFFPERKNAGHWESGIRMIDEGRLYNMDKLPSHIANNKARNHFYFIPFIMGLIGLFWMARKSPKDFAALLVLFFITGIGIIIYTNQPPNEPRERDYVLVGSFMVYSMWVGMAAAALFDFLKSKLSLGNVLPILTGLAVLSAPIVMGTQNFDDHSRRYITGARDYGANYLNSLEENAIIFSYGDNDTYPLWYAQEVEGVRPDVRIINLSLIAIDWYINQLRRKVNESEPIKLTVPPEAIRGSKRNWIQYVNRGNIGELPADKFLQFLAEDHPLPTNNGQVETYMPTTKVSIPIDASKAVQNGLVDPSLQDQIVNKIPVKVGKTMTKDDLAILDIIASNIYDRPIYFTATVLPSKLLGLKDYMQYEGIAMRVVPIKSESEKQYSNYGFGRVAADKVLNNMKSKFQWGGFDKKDVYVDDKYKAAVQAHRIIMARAKNQFLANGEQEKAVEMADLYFEAFPDMNFPYIENQVETFIDVYVRAGETEKAKKHMSILADQAVENMEFFNSISGEAAQSFGQDKRMTMNSIRQLLQLASRIGGEFQNEINTKLAGYVSQNQNMKG